MHNFKKLSETELADQLEISLAGLTDAKDKSALEQLAHDLQTHQIELEMQNRELREAQSDLEDSRDRYADLYDFAPVAYMSLDKRGVIHKVNLTGATLLGQERSRIIGTPFTRFLAQGEEITLFKHLERAYQSSGNVIDEVQLRGKDDAAVTVQIESRSLGISSQPGELCRTIVTDISERKRWIDELLVAREQAEAASHAKAQFLSRMSHELRTPLNAILGFSQLMQMSADDATIAEHRDDIGEILHSGWQLLRIVNDLINLASIEKNAIELEIGNVSIVENVRQSVETILSLARGQGITLDFCEDTCKDILVRADPARLKQVLLNLLANAVKYNRDGGSVTVNCQASVNDGCMRIAISDTGQGLRDEDIPTLFQPFSRLVEREYQVQGAGIGLAISKQLVELMNGTIGVKSVYGKGSTFWIELPLAI